MRRFGIDISKYQGGMSLKQAKNEGAEFAIIKASQTGFVDPKFESHYSAAKSAGIPVGAYHYLTSGTVAGAIEEAKFFVNCIKGKQFEYPVFVDVEHPTLRSLGKKALTEIVASFCDYVEKAGYWAGFYTNLDWYKNCLEGEKLAVRYSMWFAYWGKTLPESVKALVQMWQFGGEVNMIRSNMIAGLVCDQDYVYMDFPALIKAKGLNGYSSTAKATTAEPKPAVKPATTTAKTSTKIAVGDKVKLAAGTYIYGTKKKFADFVYNSTLYVREINGDRVVISTVKTGDITGAVSMASLKKA